MVITGLVRSTCDLWDFLLWRILLKNINPLSPESGLLYGPYDMGQKIFLHQMGHLKIRNNFSGKKFTIFLPKVRTNSSYGPYLTWNT